MHESARAVTEITGEELDGGRRRKEDVEEGNAGRGRERVSRRRVGDLLKPVVGSEVGRTS